MMRFTKMHGLGNDFIVIAREDAKGMASFIDDSTDTCAWKPDISKLCDRHYGIGADGLILILPSDKADFRMRIFNPDSSEAEMCGNGIRCMAKYLLPERPLIIETLAGFIEAQMIEDLIRVGIGKPIIEKFGYTFEPGDPFKSFPITCLSLGNPHCVMFIRDLPGATLLSIPLEQLGPKVEKNPLFPNRTNFEIAEVVNTSEIKVRVWERGVGETLACGTGACAAVVAGVLTKKIKEDSEVIVHLMGGDLRVQWSKNKPVYMTGPAEEVFTGEINLQKFRKGR